MLLVGLTGGIGSGKSTVSAMLAERGAIIIDGDAVVRELQQPGSPVVEAIAARFEGVVGDDGHLDRSALAAIVFNDPAALADLNGIVHPPLGEEIRRRIDVERATDHVVVLDLPLLTERPRSDLDATIVVDVDPEIAVERLAKSRGMDEADARARMANQASREQRVAIATHVLDNSGDVDALESQVDAVWTELRASATQR
ncbi:MAG: dephospho-CoA kinase [Acidimicrobiia bacterium]|nr:dephospho-CoA kinase [Acidimicrobiia bacterium]